MSAASGHEADRDALPVIEGFFIEQYKVDYASELLASVGSPFERLAKWEAWQPHVGQREQAKANAEMVMRRLTAAGLSVVATVDAARSAPLPSDVVWDEMGADGG